MRKARKIEIELISIFGFIDGSRNQKYSDKRTRDERLMKTDDEHLTCSWTGKLFVFATQFLYAKR